jgi:hypothetical protein
LHTDQSNSIFPVHIYTVQIHNAFANTGAEFSPASTTTDSEPNIDTVTISKAEYKSGKAEFKVEATSSEGGSVTLTVVGYGAMTWKNNKYEYKRKDVANPGATVTVTSSGGGQDTANVSQR